MADLRIVDAPVLSQESITDDVKMPTGGLGNFSVRLGDILWYVITKEQLANKSYVDLSSKGVQDKLDEHIADKANPHQVTKAQVGLGNVDNTADIDKPVSNAVSSAIITATNDMATKTYVNQKDNLKADKANTLGGYGIADAYTKGETRSRIEIDNALTLKADVTYVDGRDGDLTTLKTTDKTNLVKAINELHDTTKGVVALYDKNAAAGAGANGWTADLVLDKSGLSQQEINNYTARKLGENYSITDFIIIGENYTDENFDWSPVYERAIKHILSKGGGRLNTPNKGTPYALNGIARTDGKLVGIEIPFTGGSDFGSTAKKVDFVCESQAVKFVPLQDDMIVFRHSSSYCEIGKFQIHHNGKLRCTGFALTPQNWKNPASASQQSHNYIHDIYTYGMLDGFIYQSGGIGGCYHNTTVNCYATGTTAQGGRGLVLKAGIKSTEQTTRASPPNRNRFYNFKAFSTNVAIDIQSGDTNYFFGLSSENNTRAGVFAEIPTALRVANADSEECAVQGNVIYGLSIEAATKHAEILASRTRIYGHTMNASKTTLSSDFVSGKNGTIVGCVDITVFPEISDGVINNMGGVVPDGLPPYTVGKTDTQAFGIHDVDGRFKSYALSLDKFTGVAAVSNSVSYTSKYNNRVDFECRFNFRPLAANSTIQVALPFEANFNLYAGLATHEQSFAFPVYIQFGVTSNRQIAFARVVSLNGTTATHLEIPAPAAGWNISSGGQYNVIHAQLNYRAK